MALPAGRPPAISIYRGQARRGLGEGGGHAASHGEQFLAADPPFGRNAAALAELRPWLALDASPEDRRRLGDRLTGYAFLSSGAHLVVARLRADGVFLDRPAYFSHARAFAAERLGPAEDPGVLIAHEAAFDESWRDRDRPAPSQPPGLGTLPAAAAAAVDGAAEAATRWLGALLHARRQNRPLLVEAPLDAFAAQGGAAELACFARAALPRGLGLACRTRIFTRCPGDFLARRQADFVVAPPGGPGELAGAPANLLRIDFEGRPLAGSAIDRDCEAFAEQVVARFRQLPEGLVPFAARAGRWTSLPTAPQVSLVYNLAFALHRGKAADPDFAAHLLEQADRQGGDLPWHQLLAGDDWEIFSPAQLRRLANAAEAELTAGARRLRGALLLDRGAELLGERLAENDELLELDRRRATDQLILAGAWGRWRQHAGAQVASMRRPAALAWLGSRLWNDEAAHATREDWKRAVADLVPVTPKMLEQLVRDGRPAWPWMPPFEAEQLAELSQGAAPEVVRALRKTAASDGVQLPAAAPAPRPAALTRPAAAPAKGKLSAAFGDRRWRAAAALLLAVLGATLVSAGLRHAFPPERVPFGSPSTLPFGAPRAPRPEPDPALLAAFAKLCDALAESPDPAAQAIFEKHFRSLATLDPRAALCDPELPAGLAELAALAFRLPGGTGRPAVFVQLGLFLPTFGSGPPPSRNGKTAALLLDYLRQELTSRPIPAPAERKP